MTGNESSDNHGKMMTPEMERKLKGMQKDVEDLAGKQPQEPPAPTTDDDAGDVMTMEDIISGMQNANMLFFASRYISEHKEDFDRSSQGSFIDIQETVRISGRFAVLDLPQSTRPDQLHRNVLVASLEVRIAYLKMLTEVYINDDRSHRCFYCDLARFGYATIPMPNGKEVHVTDLLKITRDAMIHGKKDDLKKFKDTTGFEKVDDMLTKQYCMQTGAKDRMLSYDDIPSCCNPDEDPSATTDVLGNLLISEYLMLINMEIDRRKNDRKPSDYIASGEWKPIRPYPPKDAERLLRPCRHGSTLWRTMPA